MNLRSLLQDTLSEVSKIIIFQMELHLLFTLVRSSEYFRIHASWHHIMVSHYDCARQHNLRQFNLLNVKQCTEAPSDIKHASVKARVYVRA